MSVVDLPVSQIVQARLVPVPGPFHAKPLEPPTFPTSHLPSDHSLPSSEPFACDAVRPIHPITNCTRAVGDVDTVVVDAGSDRSPMPPFPQNPPRGPGEGGGRYGGEIRAGTTVGGRCRQTHRFIAMGERTTAVSAPVAALRGWANCNRSNCSLASVDGPAAPESQAK